VRVGMNKAISIGVIGAIVFASAASLTFAVDPENCLSCHRFRGLSRLDAATGELRLFFCSADYYARSEGPHARLRCTACHVRSEVDVVPHHVKTPVDCSRECHLVDASGIERLFSHQGVRETIEGSAHKSSALEALPFDPPLLRPGQSMCLYCHDQPLYRKLPALLRGPRCGNDLARCETCHDESLPVPIRYYRKHVTSRLRDAWAVRRLAQVCAVCHSDPAIVKRIGGHDVVASYLHSFHGQASMLGSTATATCIDCHSSQSGNVHRMLSPKDPESSIYPQNLPDTCRTSACHPGAPPGMSRAAVHLELHPEARTPEFYVAAIFILLTAGVMAVFLLLILLELLNTALRRSRPAEERRIRLATKLLSLPQGRALLERMSVHERLQHWALVISFVLLVTTGMPIKFSDAPWASWLINLMGGLTTTRHVHHFSGVALIVIFVYHIGYLTFRSVKLVRAARRQGNQEGALRLMLRGPQVMRLRDVLGFVQLLGYLLFLRRERPHFGRMSFVQKFEYWAVFWGVPIMGLSGIALWGTQTLTQHVSGRAINFAFIIHSDEAYLAFIYIAVVHLYSVIFSPAVVPLSAGSLSGQAPPEEIAEGHAGQLEEVAAELNVTPDEEPYRRGRLRALVRQLVRRSYALGLLCICGVIGFVSFRFLGVTLLTRQAAPVEITQIPKRIDAATLAARAEAPEAAPRSAGQRPRGPLAHFHQIPSWYQADPRNSCTTSGCHPKLPHGKRIELRAFLNMHSTFVDCTVCHAEDAAKGTAARWYSLPSREPCRTPAVIRLANLLEKKGETEPATDLDARLISLLREAVAETNVQSKLWQGIVAEMRVGVKTHAHGEYNAKIAMYRNGRIVGSPDAKRRAASQRYVANHQSMTGEQRVKTLKAVHAGIRPVGALCTPCHSPQPTLVDFRALGFSPARVAELQGSEIVRQVLSIEGGQPFHLPQILEDADGR
jgi:cytochrome b subunit of formate dehydrogenase